MMPRRRRDGTVVNCTGNVIGSWDDNEPIQALQKCSQCTGRRYGKIHRKADMEGYHEFAEPKPRSPTGGRGRL